MSDNSEPGRGWQHYVCGSAAACTNILTTFPIQKMLFRQQLHGLSATQAVRQLQSEGVGTLYRGLMPPLLQKATAIGLMFGMYDDFSRMLLKRTQGTQTPEVLVRSTAAAMAGTAEAVLTPFERVQTLLQDHRHQARFKNTPHAFGLLLREYGVKECYRGLVPILMRNGPSNALFFALRGPIKEQLPEAHTKTGNVLNDFVSGGLLGAALGLIFYPLNVLKTTAQAQVGGKFLSCWRLLQIVWHARNGSLASLYSGVGLNFYRSLLSWGIINATYEFLLGMVSGEQKKKVEGPDCEQN